MAKTKSRPNRSININKDTTILFSRQSGGEDSLHMTSLKAFNSNQIPDEFKEEFSSEAIGGGKRPIDPPYNPYSLMRLPNQNNTLRQCIEAMVTNVEGFGYRLEYIGEEDKKQSAEAENERIMLEKFLDFPNEDYSMVELRERLRRDYETFGYFYLEVIRDSLGRVNSLYHLPAHTVRMTPKDDTPTKSSVYMPRDGNGGDFQIRSKYFRRYVQVVGSRKIYFKEYGDPRSISPRTGFEEELPLEEQANEVIYMGQNTPGEVYGLPRWINQVPSVMGSRESELTNLQYFKDNAIPAMAVMVSGGYLTQETLDSIQQHFNAVRGRQAQNRILLLEASADESDASEDGRLPVPRIDIKPLNDSRQSDGLFQDYEENNSIKIRSSFRIPPIFLGLNDDYNRATAETSLVVAESQVFGPERKKMDDMINNKILSTFSPKYWRFRSLPPKITGNEEIIQALKELDSMGAVTPNLAISMANEFFDLNIPIIEERWAYYPFSLAQTILEAEGRKGSDTTKESPAVGKYAGRIRKVRPVS